MRESNLVRKCMNEGDYWEETEGQRMFFCCDICAIEFKNMIDEVKKGTGWENNR